MMGLHVKFQLFELSLKNAEKIKNQQKNSYLENFLLEKYGYLMIQWILSSYCTDYLQAILSPDK